MFQRRRRSIFSELTTETVNSGPYFLSPDEVTIIKSALTTQPYATAWTNEKASADAALNYSPTPASPTADYSGDLWRNTLYAWGLNDGHAAHSLAFAYLMTEDTAYAARSLYILREWRDHYYAPSTVNGGPGHQVAEPVGFAIKMFMAIDMLRDYIGPTELATFATWAAQWIPIGKASADNAVNNPWCTPPGTIGGRYYDGRMYCRVGNGTFWQRAMVVWAAAIEGGDELKSALDWDWQHTTSGGYDLSWNVSLNDCILPAHAGGTHTASAIAGENLEGHVRNSMGYGVFGLSAQIIIADVGKHAGYEHDHINFVSSGGNRVVDTANFYATLLTSTSDALGEAFYGADNDPAPDSSMGEFRSVFEYHRKWLLPSDPQYAGANSIVTFGGNSVRGNNKDGHILRWIPCITSVVSGEPPLGDPLWNADLSTGDISQYGNWEWNMNVSISEQVAVGETIDGYGPAQGTHLMRMRVRPGDQFGDTTGWRVVTRLPPEYTNGNQIIKRERGYDSAYTWAVLLPSGYPGDSNVWQCGTEWHASQYIPVAPSHFKIYANNMAVDVAGNVNNSSSRYVYVDESFLSGYTKGVWYVFTERYKHGIAPEGIYELWYGKKGTHTSMQPLLSRTGIGTGYTLANGTWDGNYFLYGLYRAQTGTATMIAYFGGFREYATSAAALDWANQILAGA